MGECVCLGRGRGVGKRGFMGCKEGHILPPLSFYQLLTNEVLSRSLAIAMSIFFKYRCDLSCCMK